MERWDRVNPEVKIEGIRGLNVTYTFRSHIAICKLGTSRGTQWQRVRLPIQETEKMRVPSLGQEDPLEKEMATHSSILARRIQFHGQKILAGYSPKGCKRAGRVLVTKQQLEHLEGFGEIIHIVLLAHSQAHGSLSINIYCLPPPQIICFTLSTSGPKLTIAKSHHFRSYGPSCLGFFFFLVSWE